MCVWSREEKIGDTEHHLFPRLFSLFHPPVLLLMLKSLLLFRCCRRSQSSFTGNRKRGRELLLPKIRSRIINRLSVSVLSEQQGKRIPGSCATFSLVFSSRRDPPDALLLQLLRVLDYDSRTHAWNIMAPPEASDRQCVCVWLWGLAGESDEGEREMRRRCMKREREKKSEKHATLAAPAKSWKWMKMNPEAELTHEYEE